MAHRVSRERRSMKLVVATTRPETMLGDTAVAINPEDPRAQGAGAASGRLPLMDREIPVILDNMAELGFGTGAVKITPAHDPNDFEAGKRHDLPSIQVIGEDGKMTAAAGTYAGMDRFEARKAVVAELEKLRLLEKIEPHKLWVGHCHRCRTVVEPLVSKQWWMKMKPLAEPAIAAVGDGPHHIRSRELGQDLLRMDGEHPRLVHLAPAVVGPSHSGVALRRCGKSWWRAKIRRSARSADRTKLEQDPDVLDTWFSSGLWPFSTLGWPDDTEDLQDVLSDVTAGDRLRHHLLLGRAHDHVRPGDHGRRAVPADPHSRPGARCRAPEDVEDQGQHDRSAGDERQVRHRRRAVRVAGERGSRRRHRAERRAHRCAKAFANKIWNASRLVVQKPSEGSGKPVSLADRWIAQRLNDAAEPANRNFEKHRYDQTADALYHFWWDDFCDWYLELKKLDEDWSFAYIVYEQALRLLHPLMPFITEELWQRLERRREIDRAGARIRCLKPQVDAKPRRKWRRCKRS